MSSISRRNMLQGAIAGAALASSSPISWGQAKPLDQTVSTQRKGRIKQSVCRWEYQQLSLDQLCDYGAHIGLRGIDLLQPEDFEIPRKYGLICTMGYAGAGSIRDGLNVLANHDKIEAGLRLNIPLAAKAGVPNVITFAGNRNGMSDEEGAKNTVIGLNRMKKLAEDANVTICLELLNSKVNHKDYMGDHTAWGAAVMKQVNSPHVKLLYDIYHMQIMEGDIIRNITTYHQYINHYHTGGIPGRHEIDDTQELYYPAVMRAIVATGFKGVVAQEFVPSRPDPIASLRQAIGICDV